MAVPIIADDAPSEQLRLQAVQLAAYLRGRQKELDHREAELNSRLARLECTERAAKLESLEYQGDPPRDEPQSDRTASTETLEQQWHKFRRAMVELERKRQAVARRAEQVDESRAVLQRLRDELVCIRRETLEIRLATKELWARLAGPASPAPLAASIADVRARLAEQYRQAAAELARQRAELEVIRSQLRSQHESLVRYKAQVEKQVATRQENCLWAPSSAAREKRVAGSHFGMAHGTPTVPASAYRTDD
jgi:hypothetical protein